jgi:ATP-dependent DNA ligase
MRIDECDINTPVVEKIIETQLKGKKRYVGKLFWTQTPNVKYKINLIIEKIRQGWSKRRILDEFTKAWDMKEQQVMRYFHDAVVMIHNEFDNNAEIIRDISLERIEFILSKCMHSNDNKTALQCIDMINRLHSLYVDKQEVKANINSNVIKFNFDS